MKILNMVMGFQKGERGMFHLGKDDQIISCIIQNSILICNGITVLVNNHLNDVKIIYDKDYFTGVEKAEEFSHILIDSCIIRNSIIYMKEKREKHQEIMNYYVNVEWM